VVDDAELVGDLGAAQDHDIGPLGVAREPLHHVELGGDQAPHGVREPLRDVVDRRVLAVHRAEAVGHVCVGKLGELVRELTPLGVVLAGLAGVEADVLEHGDLPVLEAPDGLAGRVAHGVGGERDVEAEQLAEAYGDRPQRVAVLRLALRPAQVRGHDHPGAGLGQGLDGRDAGPDPAVVGDLRAVQGHVEVRPDQDPFSRDALQELWGQPGVLPHSYRVSPT
jgi:hypothetical protein